MKKFKEEAMERKKLNGELTVRECFGSDNIRVKVTDNVLLKLYESGFDILGHGKYINLSTKAKPFRSLGAMSNYKLVKEDDFLSGTLKGIKVR